MPCFSTGSAEGDAYLRTEEAQAELTEVTRMLCSVCEAHPDWTKLPSDIRRWYKRHLEIDAEAQKKASARKTKTKNSKRRK